MVVESAQVLVLVLLVIVLVPVLVFLALVLELLALELLALVLLVLLVVEMEETAATAETVVMVATVVMDQVDYLVTTFLVYYQVKDYQHLDLDLDLVFLVLLVLLETMVEMALTDLKMNPSLVVFVFCGVRMLMAQPMRNTTYQKKALAYSRV